MSLPTESLITKEKYCLCSELFFTWNFSCNRKYLRVKFDIKSLAAFFFGWQISMTEMMFCFIIKRDFYSTRDMDYNALSTAW